MAIQYRVIRQSQPIGYISGANLEAMAAFNQDIFSLTMLI
jgi:hypothetical protein